MKACETGFPTLRASLVVLAATVVAFSCSDGVAGPSDLTGGVWRLRSMQVGETRFEPDASVELTLEFLDEGRLALVADCNRCGGRYSIEGDTLTVTELVCTLVLCPRPQGMQFADLVEGTSSIVGDEADRLEIESAEGRLVLER